MLKKNFNSYFIFQSFQSSSAPESSTSKRRRSEISEALEESFASIDVDGRGKKGADAKPRLVREDREEEDEDAAAEDWSYKVCSALPRGPDPAARTTVTIAHVNRFRSPSLPPASKTTL